MFEKDRGQSKVTSTNDHKVQINAKESDDVCLMGLEGNPL